ncbi:MAG: N-acetyltransferase [Segetibacter sp.]|nr:N-acetyltransferase [Segetibacter sp.]
MVLYDISIKTTLVPGDIGYIIYLHGKIYKEEYDYGVEFEAYVAKGLYEFYENYNPGLDRIWIAEHENKIIGFLLLMNRENSSCQLRYFLVSPGYRNIGLGKKLMELYMNFLHQANYHSSYLWTTNELPKAASLCKRHGFTLTEERPSVIFW